VRILLDNNLPVQFTELFVGHDAVHCRDLGWRHLENGQLVRVADEQFDVLVTVDKNMPHQTSLKGLSLRVVVLDVNSNRHAEVRAVIPKVLVKLESLEEGSYTSVGGVGSETADE
jgi:predicted nuclease of predicted toxin-antitoxin system